MSYINDSRACCNHSLLLPIMHQLPLIHLSSCVFTCVILATVNNSIYGSIFEYCQQKCFYKQGIDLKI